ncbi:ABC transporter substrate-binding protein [Paenibacillus hexagrammi]|uniref:Extracellular solute-binding protein n=1 Tax=Paenibacillus hexagrammi TaxID=2908839 RepID=A0ABY3SD25_9BACL|nr:extracellular solute-binding protein [Paenibacillus sp. YPD9-1]UJF31897.1 extracellular solute-binding protein [Paenibacillus sp. YPD9-1]
MLRVKRGAGLGCTLLATVIALAGCGSGASQVAGPDSPDVQASEPSAAYTQAAKGENITLSFFTNNSDRSVGQGRLEQELIDDYMKLNPNITIKVETLSPDPQYQDKIKVYNASNLLPDIISAWGNTNFLKPLINNNALAEINRDELGDMGFIPSSMDGFSFDGKLYGIPRNSDFWVLYYNKKIFADNGLQIPRTEADLMHVIETLRSKKIVPIAMDGREAWTSGIWFDTLLQRASGTWDTSRKAMDRSGTFTDPATMEAARAMQRWVKAGAFGEGFLNQDYGAARNMFGQGKAAMFMMGEWEMGMAADTNFPEEVRNHIGAFPIPSIEGGKGSPEDLTAWFGGGYAVSNNSKHKKEAIAFLRWMFRPDGWSKSVWQNGITFPAQTYDQYLTGKETEIQNDLTRIFGGSKTYSGTVAQDKFSSDTQKTYYDSIQKLEGLKMTPEDFVKVIDEAADKSAKATK